MKIKDGALSSGKTMLIVICLALGTIIGELIGIEKGFERFGEWLKVKSGNSGDKGFVNAFVSASLTVCIGAMAIVGAIQDALLGDFSTLALKSVLDFMIIVTMTSSLGKGCIFSAIPILLFEQLAREQPDYAARDYACAVYQRAKSYHQKSSLMKTLTVLKRLSVRCRQKSLSW